METRHLVCIQCPLGCLLTVSLQKGKVQEVQGHTCKRGMVYAQKEITTPTRTVTSTVSVTGSKLPVVAVKTQSPIPKEKIFACMAEINGITVAAPVQIGDVLIQNLCGTGVALVATAAAL